MPKLPDTPAPTPVTTETVFDNVRYNKWTLHDFEIWLEDQSMNAWEDGYEDAWREAKAQDGACG